MQLKLKVRSLSHKKLPCQAKLGSWVNHSRVGSYQRQDLDLIIVHEWLDCQEKPVRDLAASYSPDVRKLWIEWDNLHHVEGVLYHRRIEQQTQQLYNQLIVPHKLRKEFIHLCHNPVLSGHLGIDKTVNKIQQKTNWRMLSMCSLPETQEKS